MVAAPLAANQARNKRQVLPGRAADQAAEQMVLAALKSPAVQAELCRIVGAALQRALHSQSLPALTPVEGMPSGGWYTHIVTRTLTRPR